MEKFSASKIPTRYTVGLIEPSLKNYPYRKPAVVEHSTITSILTCVHWHGPE